MANATTNDSNEHEGIESERRKINDEINDDHSLHCITYSTFSSSPNSICWSADESLAVITDKRIYVLKLVSSCKRKKPGSDFGLQFETTVVENVKSVNYDTGVETKNFHRQVNGSFLHRQSFLLDSSTIENDNFSAENKNRFCQLKWSPLSSTKDGRCVLATLSANGNVYIHSSKPLTGKWYPILNITDKLFHYLMENNWLDFQFCSPTTESTETYLQFNSGDFERHKFRKHLLFTTSICWCPTNIPCNNCLQIPDHSNLSHYHSYHSYVKCKHSKLLFLTASKNGYMFLWLITLFLTDDSHHSAKLLLWWKTDTMWPISSGIQQSIIGFYAAVGFTNGCIKLYHVHVDEQNKSSYLLQVIDIWGEVDMLRVSFLEWINPNDGIMRLVATKESEIVVFKIKYHADQLTCSTCEIAPSCHASPITSLQVINNKFVLTSSFTTTQYFDIDNEIVPVCEKNILRGFKCLGAAVDGNMTLLAQVSCPNKLLLHQSMFVKQMEVSFYPFLSVDALATKILDGRVDLSMNVREFFAVSSTDNFLLPTVLHKYCDEPVSYDGLTRHELQVYLCFNKLRCLQQEGSRTILTREEVEDGKNLKDFDDPTLRQLNHAIEFSFIQETLTKGLNLIASGCVPSSPRNVLILSLMADWLCQVDWITAADISEKCYRLFGDTHSINMFATLKDQSSLVQSTPFTENKSSEPIIQSQVQWKRPREKCGFCGLEIAMDSLYTAVCLNKHGSFRCSLTLQICTFTSYRKCAGCSRIALDKILDGQLSLEAILLNIDNCPFCGCKFVCCSNS